MRVLVASAVALALLSFARADEKDCKFKLDDTYYELEGLKKDATAPYRVFDNTEVYVFNLCGAPATCLPGMPGESPACTYLSKMNPMQAHPDDITNIGSMSPMAQPIGPMDIADINWKSQHMPPFKDDTKGVKLVFPPYGQMAGGAPGGAGSNPYGQPGGQPGYGQQQMPNGYPGGRRDANPQLGDANPQLGDANPWGNQQNPWGTPPPPPQGFGNNPYGGQAGGPGMMGGGKHSNLGVTIIALCDESVQDGQPIQFARGQTYKDRSQQSYLFGVASKSACPATKKGDILGTGLTWGWLFIIILAAVVFLYCVGGMIYKYKKLGVTGLETVPNIEFWRDYPGLVKDGIAFTVTKIQQCLAKGGGGGGYSTV